MSPSESAKAKSIDVRYSCPHFSLERPVLANTKHQLNEPVIVDSYSYTNYTTDRMMGSLKPVESSIDCNCSFLLEERRSEEDSSDGVRWRRQR